MRIIEKLEEQLSSLIIGLYDIEESVVYKSVKIQKTRKEFDGDYTLNVFPFVKFARTSPEQLATAIGEKIVAENELLSGFNVIKGFLNLEVSMDYWKDFFSLNKDKSTFGHKSIMDTAPVVIEYSSPNTNKPLQLPQQNNQVSYF